HPPAPPRDLHPFPTRRSSDLAVLSSADRSQVDRELNGKLEDAGDRRAGALAKAAGYRLDPASAIRRVRGATKDRRVGLRPAPDTDRKSTRLNSSHVSTSYAVF